MTIDGKEVQFRTFGGDTSWQGEIKGTSAAGGKIGGGNVDFYCQKVFKKSIWGNKAGEAQFLAESKTSNFKYNETIYELYKKHNKGGSPTKPEIPKDQFMALLSEQEPNFLNSKIICMKFLDIIMAGNSKDRNAFATELFRYASSDTDQSSYFVKLY
jgi:hypothetical protein